MEIIANNPNKSVKILNVAFSGASSVRLLIDIGKILKEKDQINKFYIVTPNPEIVLKASDDELLNNILNNADFSIADGIGILAAAKYFSLPRPEKIIERIIVLIKQGIKIAFSIIFDQKWISSELPLIKGRKLFEDLVMMGDEMKLNYVLLGDEKTKSASKAVKILKSKYKKVNLTAFDAPALNINGIPKNKQGKLQEQDIIEKINKIKPDMIFIGFGCPRQEKWLYRQYQNIYFKGAMVIGSTLDYYSGTRVKIPSWIEDLNLEWFWRILTGSQTPKRIFNASIQFPLRVFLNKLVKGQTS